MESDVRTAESINDSNLHCTGHSAAQHSPAAMADIETLALTSPDVCFSQNKI